MSLTEFDQNFSRSLSEEELHTDPVEQFRKWFDDASRLQGVTHPEAMIVATVDAEGRPNARTVLLKQFDQRGFVFFTNYTSTKGRSLEANPFAEAVFYWDALARQVRVSGCVEKLSYEESDAYFQTRARGSQLGAWASPQSQSIQNREELEAKLQEVEAKWEGQTIPCPDFWGGYRIVPDRIEFWQGREFRIHDRFAYERTDNQWNPVRLAP